MGLLACRAMASCTDTVNSFMLESCTSLALSEEVLEHMNGIRYSIEREVLDSVSEDACAKVKRLQVRDDICSTEPC